MKSNVKFTLDDEFVLFDRNIFYTFRSDMSIGHPRDFYFNVVNIPLITVLKKASESSSIMRQALSLAIHLGFHEDPIIQRSAEQMLWGYTDPLLTFIRKIIPDVDNVFRIQKNDTWERGSSVWTGKSTAKLTNTFRVFNGSVQLDLWSNKYANMINGTDGRQYGSDTSKDMKYVFNPVLMRSLPFTYEKEEVIRGVKTQVFRLDDIAFASAAECPENDGFYSNAPSGVFNISKPNSDAPIFVSRGHFSDADPFYTSEQNVRGMKPIAHGHQSRLWVEPRTGLTIAADADLQINVEVDTSMWPARVSGEMMYAFIPVVRLRNIQVHDAWNSARF